MYGIEPNQDTMMAGFQYYKKTKSGVKYIVLGRVHMFQISDLGIYCRSLIEKDALDSICKIVEENNNLKLWIPPDDDSVSGIIQVKGKEKKLLLLLRTKKDERISFDISMYEPLVVGEEEPIIKERFYKIIEQMD